MFLPHRMLFKLLGLDAIAAAMQLEHQLLPHFLWKYFARCHDAWYALKKLLRPICLQL